METANLVLNILYTLATTGLLIVAIIGLKSWQKEDVLKRRFNLASSMRSELEGWIEFGKNCNFHLLIEILPKFPLLATKLEEYFLVVNARKEIIKKENIKILVEFVLFFRKSIDDYIAEEEEKGISVNQNPDSICSLQLYKSAITDKTGQFFESHQRAYSIFKKIHALCEYDILEYYKP